MKLWEKRRSDLEEGTAGRLELYEIYLGHMRAGWASHCVIGLPVMYFH